MARNAAQRLWRVSERFRGSCGEVRLVQAPRANEGVIDCLVQPQLLERVHALGDSAEDVSHRLYAEFDELYIKNLGF